MLPYQLLNIFRKLVLLWMLFYFSNEVAAQIYTSGNTYFDSTGFVEYIAGDVPVVISVPHGGYLEPDTIPDRLCDGCSYLRDSYTQEIGRGMIEAFYEQTGCYPHVIINLLHRKKFDANRDIGDAADGNSIVEQSWYNYHNLIDSAKAQIMQDYGRGIFLDLHGHAHTIQRIELGYLLSGNELRLTDADLNTNNYISESSIRTLVSDNLQTSTHSELLRGNNSLGTLLEEKNFPCVPSSADPFPQLGDPYFSGGYNTVRHGSRDSEGDIDGIQIECNSEIRFNSTLRETLIDSLTTSINQYIDFHYHDQYIGNYCSLLQEVALSAKVLLEGPYQSAGMMNTDLGNLIPLQQPYNLAPYNYSGTESLNSIPPNMVDWVLVEARSGNPALSGNRQTTTVERVAAILLNNGDIVASDGVSPLVFSNLTYKESYYFCIRHRNHLDILSSEDHLANGVIEMDFSQEVNRAFGTEQLKDSGDSYALMFAADFTQDAIIQVSDYNAWIIKPARISVYDLLDADLDGTILNIDYDTWYLNQAKIGIAELQY